MSSERILIVEDERLVALDLKRRLERFGYAVHGPEENGADAIRSAEIHKPDIVLMDILLPGDLDGIDAAREIRARFAIPVIFLTAYADEQILNRAKEAEPLGYIIKPVKDRDLYSTIDIALYKHSMEKRLIRQEKWFEALFSSIGDGIIATERDGTIELMNPAAELLTGWKEAEAKSRSISEVFPVLDERTRLPLELPGFDGLYPGGQLMFFDNILLKNKVGAFINIEGSVADIHDDRDQIEGKVVAFRDITKIKSFSETISYQARHDSLTGLANREEFYHHVRELFLNAHLTGNTHGLIYLDLDQFKLVNDVAGHAAGDELLRRVSADIRSIVRERDICARLGGDEFAVLIQDVDLAKIEEFATLILKQLSHRYIWQKNLFHISASISVIPIDSQAKDIHGLLSAADDACYLAKEEGGNRIKLYTQKDMSFHKRRGEMQWISRLTRALEDDRFALYFQAIKHVHPGVQTRGEPREMCEITLRMIDEDGSIVEPIDFIPAAEKYNLMPTIDRWVIQELLRHYPGIIERNGAAGCTMFCINLSGASVADEEFLSFVVDRIRNAEIPHDAICFEITETTAITNLTGALRFMKRLKELGCSFALDDFGSGFSSLSYLKSLPVDFLKMDGSFVQDIATNPVNYALVEAINNIGHVMGLNTVAEYVEKPEILAKLADLNVDFAQGFEIAAPRPLSELM